MSRAVGNGGTGQYAELDGVRLHYEIDGEGDRPWIVLSNSIGTTIRMWDPQVAFLSESFRVLRYDQRGHGTSSAPEGNYEFATLAGDVWALADALGIGAAHLMGASMGAITVLHAAVQRPDRVQTVVAAGCSPRSTPASASQWKNRGARALTDGMDSLVDEMIDRWFPLGGDPAGRDAQGRVAEMLRETPAAGFAGGAGALADFDLTDHLGYLSQPCLLMAGSDDLARTGIEQIHKLIPGSTSRVIAEAGHLCNMERPELFNEAVREFFAIASSHKEVRGE